MDAVTYFSISELTHLSRYGFLCHFVLSCVANIDQLFYGHDTAPKKLLLKLSFSWLSHFWELHQSRLYASYYSKYLYQVEQTYTTLHKNVYFLIMYVYTGLLCMLEGLVCSLSTYDAFFFTSISTKYFLRWLGKPQIGL